MESRLVLNDPEQMQTLKAFTEIALHALLTGSCKLNMKVGKEARVKDVREFGLLRKVFKAEMYKQRGLEPRPSDVDFEVSSSRKRPQMSKEQLDAKEAVDDDLTKGLLLENHELATMFANYITKEEALTKPPLAQASVPGLLNNMMLKLFARMAQEGDMWRNREDATLALVKEAILGVQSVMPSDWDTVMDVMAKVVGMDKLDWLSDDPYNRIKVLMENTPWPDCQKKLTVEFGKLSTSEF